MKNHDPKSFLKKTKNPKFYGQNKILFWQFLGSFTQVPAYRSYSKNAKNVDLQLIVNKIHHGAHVPMENGPMHLSH
jgi:hypothetical protein